MTQTPERRMYLMWRSLKRSRSFQREYRKGWVDGPLMQVARRFKVPVRIVRDAIEAQRSEEQ